MDINNVKAVGELARRKIYAGIPDDNVAMAELRASLM